MSPRLSVTSSCMYACQAEAEMFARAHVSSSSDASAAAAEVSEVAGAEALGCLAWQSLMAASTSASVGRVTLAWVAAPLWPPFWQALSPSVPSNAMAAMKSNLRMTITSMTCVERQNQLAPPACACGDARP